MSTARWQQIESIAASAMDRPADERSTYLAVACAGDDILRREVESLLGFETAADEFLQNSAMDEAARQLASAGTGTTKQPVVEGYTIDGFLGAGGMGDVYRARDIRLGRDVAIKVVQCAPSDAFARRFEEEARTASALSHPNIVTIHAVGSHDDVSFIVMELVAGRTLRDMLDDSPLPLATSIDIAVQLADALAAAHAAGIVHRDLKPDNVMVTPDGLVKVLDFGIAKRERGFGRPATSDPQPSPPRSDLLTTHAGTAGYMSPEQAAGRPVDYRSDQFSLGAILYEMVSGERAFERESKSETLRAVIEGDVSPLVSVSRDVPPALADFVERCLKRDPADRYTNRRAPAIELRRMRDELVLQNRLPPPPTRRKAIAMTVLTMVGAATGLTAWRLGSAGVAIRRLAVLPLLNLTGDDGTEILCDGITEILIRQLSALTDLRVIARNTAFQFKGKPYDARAIGRQLETDAVLIGSVSRRGGRAVVEVELTNTLTGEHIWGDRFNRLDGDVLAIQNEIAAAIISHGLAIRLSDAQVRGLTDALTADPEAYSLFLRAVHYFRQDTEGDYLKARSLLTQAVDRDRSFALAHLTLASSYSVMAVDGYLPPRTAWPLSSEHVTRALERDPDLPDAHAERATEAFFYARDWASAQESWKRALGSRRSEIQAELYTAYVLLLWALGRNDEALRFARTARDIDPLSPMLAVREADVLAQSGNVQAAEERYLAIIREWPTDSRAYPGLADVQQLQGRYDDAIETWRNVYPEGEDGSLDSVLSGARTREGYRRFEQYLAKRALADMDARARLGGYVSPIDIARAYARLADAERSFDFLDAAITDRSPGLVFLNVDRAWDNIRADSRFTRAVRQVGLPPQT